jgi:hypothetical protein
VSEEQVYHTVFKEYTAKKSDPILNCDVGYQTLVQRVVWCGFVYTIEVVQVCNMHEQGMM